MEWYMILTGLSLVATVLALIQIFQLWSRFKIIKIGEKLSQDWVDENSNKIKIAISIIGISCILGTIGILIRSY
ncbi:hypothetical protein JOC75_000937 [Metabacillus crassostreae]|uniref:hypothetical protein n=1 Tax=Metabacillus crassostreae TaxID=929098 RepID=UPI00195CDCB8|nr:hypothetical protein [Metabacillus crassostreae]MBM7602967.1 hypothetical protein [Metabacillus crassostreae]